jgi:hypothetical protein
VGVTARSRRRAAAALVLGLLGGIAVAATASRLAGGANSVLGSSFHVDGSPPETATMSFHVPRSKGPFAGELRLFAESGSKSGVVVHAGAKTVRSAPFAARTWIALDVTRLLARGGPVALKLEDASATAIRFAGAASAEPPVLVLRRGGKVAARLAPRGTPRAPRATATSGASEQGLLVPGTSAVIAAAGDIACDPSSHDFGVAQPGHCAERATSNLLLRIPHLAAVLPLGDNQYECGRASAYQASYAPSWGRLLKITHPVPGNHEYGRPCHENDASPYFTYFGKAAGPFGKGWYSYDVARWHLIALNSECDYGRGTPTAVGGCRPGSPEERWLKRDLATHHKLCTLAYWHEPRFSSGEHGDATAMSAIWNDLVAAHADVVLSGHNHDYERFAPLGATPDPSSGARSTTT